MRPMPPAQLPPRAPSKRREGAVMLAVLLLIMMSTLTGMVAIQSSTFELRTVGTERRVLVTHDVAEAALNAALGAVNRQNANILPQVNRSTLPAGTRLAAEEPAFTAPTASYRIAADEAFAGVTGAVIETSPTAGESLGPSLGVAPYYVVDVNDVHVYNVPIPGESASGRRPLIHMIATYTARARIRPAGDALDGTGYGSASSIHETAANCRAYAFSGPIANPEGAR